MKKIIRFFFVTIGIFIFLFLAAAILVPILCKDKILAVVKTELNENLDAKTDFRDISLSLFRHFPHLSVRIHDLSITGKESFKKDTLISAQQIDLALDLQKALKGTYDILKIDFIKPRIHAIVHANGAANWNIVKPSKEKTTTTEGPQHFSINLRHYAIEHGFVEYTDEQQKMSVIVDDVVHEGSGSFKSEIFTLNTQTSINALTVVYGKVPYLSKVKTGINFDIDVDSKKNKYSFDTKAIKLNGLTLSAKGFVQLPDTSNTIVDVEFKTPSNDFKDFLSIVPGVYQNNFKDIKTTGKATIDGMVKGVYNQHHIPAFTLNIGVEDGSLQYPGLPQKIANVQMKLAITNPDGIPDHTVIDLKKGHMEFGPEPFDFNILVKTPLSDKRIEASAKGKLDLSQFNMFVKLDDGTKLSGIINANVSVKGAVADAEKRDFDSLDADGTITFENLNYSSKEYPDVATLNSMTLTFTPENITVSNLKAHYLNTQFSGDGSVNNLLGYYLHKGVLTGSIHLLADRIDGNKWKHTFTKPKAKVVTPQPVEEPFIAPSKLNISFNAEVDEIEYDHVKIKNVQGLMVMGDEVINIQNVQAHALDGEVKINGFYSSHNNKQNPDLDFEYLVSLGRLTVL